MSSYGRLGPARSGHLGYAARQPLGGCGLRTWIREIPGQTLQSADRCSLMGGHAPRRARDLGIAPGVLRPGEQNAISDVSGVLIGQVTLEQEPDIHTGVTAIVPAQIGAARRTLPCACFVGNGHGKLVGSTQVAELGTLETPIVLTATLSVFRAADAVLTHMMARPGYESVLTLNPVVGETNDGYLSNIRSRPVTEEHVLAALDKAAGGEVAEGCVGAGTGTAALGYKAGVGTSSRVVDLDGRGVTVGVLVQANFSGTLEVLGVPMPAAELLADAPEDEEDDSEQGGNSCMIVVATDAPVDARQLGRVARRAVFAMARVGSDFAGGSGDYAVAFATAAERTPPLAEHLVDGLFRATTETVEEALLNSLFMARDTIGTLGHRKLAVPHAEVLKRLSAPRDSASSSLHRHAVERSDL